MDEGQELGEMVGGNVNIQYQMEFNLGYIIS